MAQLPVEVGTPSTPVSLDTNFLNTDLNFDELYAYDVTLFNLIGTKEPLKGADDNYVTDAEKVILSNTAGTNTGDQVVPTALSDLTDDSLHRTITDAERSLWNTPGVSSINELSDVDTTGKATDKILVFDASGNLVVGDGAAGGEGDITGVIAGTRLEGGGLSGTVTVNVDAATDNAITANSAKVGITTAQANEITANTAKISFDSTSSTKLAGIATGAEVNVQSDWTAGSGDAFILNKPVIVSLSGTNTWTGTQTFQLIELPADSVDEDNLNVGTGANQINQDSIVSGDTYVQTANDYSDTEKAAVAANTAARVTVISGNVTIPTTAVPANTCNSAITAVASGVVAGDVVVGSFNADPSAITGWGPAAVDGLWIYGWCTTDQVNFRICNRTDASITGGASQTLNWQVVK